MPWIVTFEDAFDAEFERLDELVQDEILARAKLLESEGPSLGRPFVDTLKGSGFKNMKELRFDAGHGVWRVAFAFDPERTALLLVAGDKSGMASRRFYTSLIDRADRRYAAHLRRLAALRKES